MDLKRMDVEYALLKKELQKAKEICSKFEKNIINLKIDKDIHLGNAAQCERDANDSTRSNDEKGKLLNDAKNHRQLAKQCEDNLKDTIIALEQYKEKVSELKKQIDAKIAEVMQDPEVKKQLEEALKVRKGRAAEKLRPLVEERDKKEKEKDELTKRKDRLVKMSEAIKKNPELKKALEESVKYRKELKELENELKTCKDDTRELAIRRRIDELRDTILPVPLKKLATEARKEKLEITLADIDGIVANGCIFEKDGSLNLGATLQKYDKDMAKTIKTRTMEINTLNKKIEPYKDIISKKEETAERSEVSGEQQEGTEGKKEAGEEKEEKPKWWQFRKRFQAWKERREAEKAKKAQKALPESEQEQTPSNKARKHLMESLIVRDAYDQMARSQGIETRTQARKEQGR